MNTKRLTAICLILAVLCVGLGAWAVVGQVRASKLSARVRTLEAEAQQTTQTSVSRLSDPDAVAAEFDGGVVTAAEAAEEYDMISAYYQLMGMDESEYEEDAKTTVLEGLVESKILEIKAKEFGVYELTDAEKAELEASVQEQYEDNVRYYMEFRFDESKTEDEIRAETIEYLDENGYSYDDLLREAEQNAWQERLYDYVTANLTVSDEQMREFYESQLESAELTYSADYDEYEMDAEAGRAMVWNPEGVRRIDSILIPFADDQGADYLSIQAAIENGDTSQQTALDALYTALEPTAQAVLDRLNAGEDFDALKAECGSVNDIGSFVSEKSTVCGENFRDAALALANVGDISGLVRVDGGIAILRYTADVPAGAVAYEEVEAELRSTYEEELKSSQYSATVDQWMQEANIVYHTDSF